MRGVVVLAVVLAVVHLAVAAVEAEPERASAALPVACANLPILAGLYWLGHSASRGRRVVFAAGAILLYATFGVVGFGAALGSGGYQLTAMLVAAQGVFGAALLCATGTALWAVAVPERGQA